MKVPIEKFRWLSIAEEVVGVHPVKPLTLSVGEQTKLPIKSVPMDKLHYHHHFCMVLSGVRTSGWRHLTGDEAAIGLAEERNKDLIGTVHTTVGTTYKIRHIGKWTLHV